MSFVHHCPFCSWHRDGAGSTMLDPRCEKCGGTLRAVAAEELEQARRDDADVSTPTAKGDGTTVLALLIILPLILPIVGVQVGDVSFAVPLVLLIFATARLLRAAHETPAWCGVLSSFAVATAGGALASAIAIGGAVLNGSPGTAAFYAGAVGSAGFVAGAVLLARRSLVARRWSGLVDAALIGLVILALAVWFLVLPGMRHGDVALTAVVVADLVALLLVGLSAVARGAGPARPAEWWVTLACGAVLAGDALVSAAAAGDVRAMPTAVALLWGVAAFSLAAAADHGFERERRRRSLSERASDRRWIVWRIALPLAAVLALPATAGALALAERLDTLGAAYFTALSLTALGLAFGRQAHLLGERQRAVVRERRLRHEATLRSEELEALTGLATTMTQTLEEAPIVEQALGVLHTAARATSAALHVETEVGVRVAAAAGDWHTEREWAPSDRVSDVQVTTRGRRTILRLPLAARGHRIGTVTLVRPESEPFDPHGVELLRLLVDQMAVAVQNARDYREKLEQAIRDPLTGLYNRRFFLEALEKEVQRSERYGSEASVVIFDVDDFKLVNDSHGHALGDAVLRRIGLIAEDIIRPADSFARIGGEEFALLLPETKQLEALLVAERVRTAVSRQEILPDRRVTISGGVASCPSDARSADELQRLADGALYWAKRNGKDLCAVASEAIGDPGASAHDGMLAHLYALVAMIDAQQLHTRDHSENVAAYAVAIGQALGLERERMVKLRRAAMLHDVGKIAVRSEVLAKPGKLTDEEFAEILAHPVVGGVMLAHAGLDEEADWVRHHHERADGRGYPDGLTLDELPLEARIIFVCDAFEAMTSDRPYRTGMAASAALEELRRCAGTQFDPTVVELLGELVGNGRLTVLALRSDA